PLEQAFDYATAVADAGVAVLEDPCPLDPDSEFARLRAHCPIPLLVDFGCWYLRDANLFVAQGAQALSTKPGRFGLSDCRLMQQGVEQAGGRVVAGLMGESTLGTVAGLQFAAAVRDPLLPAELTWFHAMTDRITNLQPQIVDGAMALPDTPSVASLVDWAAVERLSL
ncbi:MAG: enolase C-terminal domain-like protein, partial [Pseudorhodoplanes sp.]